MVDLVAVRYVGVSREPMVVVHGPLEYEYVYGEPVELPAELVHRPGGLLSQIEWRDGVAHPNWELVDKPKPKPKTAG